MLNNLAILMQRFNHIIHEDGTFVTRLDFKVPAGFPSPAMDYMEDRIDLVKELVPNPLSTFYASCEGDSMLDAHIPPNAILVIDKSLTARNGDIVVAYLNGGYTVKYLKLQAGKCYLVPANASKNYPETEITQEMEMIVWGVVTNVIINTKHLRLCTL